MQEGKALRLLSVPNKEGGVSGNNLWSLLRMVACAQPCSTLTLGLEALEVVGHDCAPHSAWIGSKGYAKYTAA